MRPKGKAKREAIINAAIEVIGTEGVFGTTTRKIADKAEINLATLHYQFVNKDEILTKVLEHLIAKNRASAEEQVDYTTNLTSRVEQLINLIWTEVQTNPIEQLTLYHLTMYALSLGDSQFAKNKYESYMSIYHDSLFETNHTLESDELANFVFNCMIGIIFQWLTTKDTDRAEHSVKLLIKNAQAMADDFLPEKS